MASLCIHRPYYRHNKDRRLNDSDVISFSNIEQWCAEAAQQEFNESCFTDTAGRGMPRSASLPSTCPKSIPGPAPFTDLMPVENCKMSRTPPRGSPSNSPSYQSTPNSTPPASLNRKSGVPLRKASAQSLYSQSTISTTLSSQSRSPSCLYQSATLDSPRKRKESAPVISRTNCNSSFEEVDYRSRCQTYSPPPRSKPHTQTETIVKTDNIVKTMLKFYNSDTYCRSLCVEGREGARQVAARLLLACQAREELHWAIVEHVAKFKLERSLEDHESALHVYRSWGHSEENRFYLRKDFRKYELFESSLTSFPGHMICRSKACKDSKDSQSLIDTPNKQFLQNIANGDDNALDIQGCMLLREGKKSWKKHYFILKKCGLYYSTKGTCKNPDQMVRLSTLSDVNIYTAQQAKKTLGAPNNFCIVLKPKYCVTNVNELTMMCAEDEQARTCWLTALRLVKYGDQLLTNHSQWQDRGLREDVSPQHTNLDRQAVDFTYGTCGRVIECPEKVKAIAASEGFQWRSKFAQRRVSPPSSPSSRHTTPRPAVMELHLLQPWFYGDISREDAAQLITDCGLTDGVFLVRESKSVLGTFVLSLAHHHKVKHCQIQVHTGEDSNRYFTLDHGQTKFYDLLQLIEFYKFNVNTLPTKLTHYVTRLI